MYERPCTHTHPPKSSCLHGVFIPKGRDSDQRYRQVKLGGKRTRCNLVVCWNRGAGGNLGQSEHQTWRWGRRTGLRALERDLLTQLAWGQVFSGESSFLLGPLGGGFFPEFSFSSSPSRTKQSIIMELGLPGLSLSSVLGSQYETLPGRQDSRQCPIIALFFNVDFHKPHRQTFPHR